MWAGHDFECNTYVLKAQVKSENSIAAFSYKIKFLDLETLTLRPCTGMGMELHKFLDKALSSCHKSIQSIEGFAKKLKL